MSAKYPLICLELDSLMLFAGNDGPLGDSITLVCEWGHIIVRTKRKCPCHGCDGLQMYTYFWDEQLGVHECLRCGASYTYDDWNGHA